MSNVIKSYGCFNTRANSGKTLTERANCAVPHFSDHIRKFEEEITADDIMVVTSPGHLDYLSELKGISAFEASQEGRKAEERNMRGKDV